MRTSPPDLYILLTALYLCCTIPACMYPALLRHSLRCFRSEARGIACGRAGSQERDPIPTEHVRECLAGWLQRGMHRFEDLKH